MLAISHLREMESSPALLGSQTCTCSCKHSIATYSGSSDFARQRVDSNFLAGSRQELYAPLKFKLSRARLSPSLTTRCLYSPLVDSFEAVGFGPRPTKIDGRDGEVLLVPSSSSINFLRPALKTSSEDGIVHQQSSRRNDRPRDEEGCVQDDDYTPAQQDPVAAANGDPAFLVTVSGDAGHLEARRTARYQPQTMSLTHGFRSAGNRVSSVIGVAGGANPAASKLVRGPAGLLMGVVVAVVGIATALQRVAVTQPQKVCSRCDGYGVECCDVCDGAGRISWEGKAHRVNTCPRCFGSCLKKCPRCDGYRAKKETPAVLQKLKTRNPPSKKSKKKIDK